MTQHSIEREATPYQRFVKFSPSAQKPNLKSENVLKLYQSAIHIIQNKRQSRKCVALEKMLSHGDTLFASHTPGIRYLLRELVPTFQPILCNSDSGHQVDSVHLRRSVLTICGYD
eukprot:UN03716